jgi:arabinofuranan 3-O-arabinosyltransferase
MTSGWAVRSSIPLTPAGTIRLLDSVESVLVTGEGSPGLASVLARSGVRYVLLRSDLDYAKTRTTPPAIAQRALEASPGLFKVASFGPVVGGGNRTGAYVDHGLDAGVPALQIYEVRGSVRTVGAYDLSAVTTVVGGPESLLNLAAAGQLGDAPTVLAGDLPAGVKPGRTVLTDDLRKRELSFGLLHDNASATLSAGADYRVPGAAHDYLPAWAEGAQTTQTFTGVADVRASSSFADAQPLVGSRPEHLPFAALDGDVTTSWRTPPNVVSAGQFIEVVFDQPRAVDRVEILFDTGADNLPTTVTVSSGPNAATASTFSDRVTVNLNGGNVARTLRITIDAVIGVRTGQGAVGIAEVRIPGLTAQRSLALPALPAGTNADAVVLAAAPGSPACQYLGDTPTCSADLARGSEDGGRIDRSFTLPTGGSYTSELLVQAKPGAPLNTVLDSEVAAHAPLGLGPTVTTSSTGYGEPATRPGAAVDDDPATAWFPSPEDDAPWLKLQWATARTITGLRIATDPAIAAARPYRVTVFGDGGTRYGVFDADGVLTFDSPLTATSYDPYQGTTTALPIAVGELQALPRATTPPIGADAPVTIPCGSGPSVRVNGTTYATTATFTWSQLMRGEPTRAQLCARTGAAPSTVDLTAGANRVVVGSSSLVEPVRLALARPATASPAASSAPLQVGEWSGTDRGVDLPAAQGARLLVMRENTNPGWQATLNGVVLNPMVVDGWQQGWLVPAGAGGPVHITFAPDRTYRTALLVGAALLGALALVGLLLARRRSVRVPRHQARPAPGRVPGGSLAVVLGAVALLSVGGWLTLVLGAVAATASVVLYFQTITLGEVSQGRVRRVLRAGWALGPAACLALGGYLWWQALHTPWVDPHISPWPQAVAVAGLGALWVSTVLGRRPLGKSLAILISGRSTR